MKWAAGVGQDRFPPARQNYLTRRSPLGSGRNWGGCGGPEGDWTWGSSTRGASESQSAKLNLTMKRKWKTEYYTCIVIMYSISKERVLNIYRQKFTRSLIEEISQIKTASGTNCSVWCHQGALVSQAGNAWPFWPKRWLVFTHELESYYNNKNVEGFIIS